MGEHIKEKDFTKYVGELVKHFPGRTTLTMSILKSLGVKQCSLLN